MESKLTPDEIYDITGKVQPAVPRLRSDSIPYVPTPHGKRAEKYWAARKRNPRPRKETTPEAVERRRRLVLFHANKRRAAKMQRLPAWADQSKIKEIYDAAAHVTRTTNIRHDVDHVIPLQGSLASGLHVHNNLQIITAVENSQKKNKFEPC